MIQTPLDELNWVRRQTFHELNSLSLVLLMKSSTFGQGLRYAPQNVIVNCLLGLLNTLLFVYQLN